MRLAVNTGLPERSPVQKYPGEERSVPPGPVRKTRLPKPLNIKACSLIECSPSPPPTLRQGIVRNAGCLSNVCLVPPGERKRQQRLTYTEWERKNLILTVANRLAHSTPVCHGDKACEGAYCRRIFVRLTQARICEGRRFCCPRFTLHIKRRASTSTMRLVRGMFSFSTNSSSIRSNQFNFCRLSDLRMKW
jgi:hypothetical protein